MAKETFDQALRDAIAKSKKAADEVKGLFKPPSPSLGRMFIGPASEANAGLHDVYVGPNSEANRGLGDTFIGRP